MGILKGAYRHWSQNGEHEEEVLYPLKHQCIYDPASNSSHAMNGCLDVVEKEFLKWVTVNQVLVIGVVAGILGIQLLDLAMVLILGIAIKRNLEKQPYNMEKFGRKLSWEEI